MLEGPYRIPGEDATRKLVALLALAGLLMLAVVGLEGHAAAPRAAACACEEPAP